MKKIIFSILAGLLFISCANQDIETTYVNQEAAINSYIESNFKDIEPYVNSGSVRVTVPYDQQEEAPEIGESLEAGDSLFFYYVGRIFNSAPSTVFATNIESVAQDNNLLVTEADYQIKGIKYGNTTLIKGLQNGLNGIKEGERAIILFSGKYGYGDKPMYNVPKYSALAFEIYVTGVKKN